MQEGPATPSVQLAVGSDEAEQVAEATLQLRRELLDLTSRRQEVGEPGRGLGRWNWPRWWAGGQRRPVPPAGPVVGRGPVRTCRPTAPQQGVLRARRRSRNPPRKLDAGLVGERLRRPDVGSKSS
jgi:hypothetical protein